MIKGIKPMIKHLRKFKVDKKFQPFPNHDGDELFQNGIFQFNITGLLKFIQSKPQIFQPEEVSIKEIRKLVASNLNESTIQTANIREPIILAEIAPDRFNTIDGRHRVERAYRNGVSKIFAYKIRAEQHIAFLTSVNAYQQYIDRRHGGRERRLL